MTTVIEERTASAVDEGVPDAQFTQEESLDKARKTETETETETISQSEHEVDSQAPKKKEPTLTPAPLPKKSPWKSISSGVPVAIIPVESLEVNKKKKNKITAPVGSGTKWVPMKASIVVSGSKKSGSAAKKNSPKPANNGKSTNAGSRKKKQQQGPAQGQNIKKQQPKFNHINGKNNDNGEKFPKEEYSNSSQVMASDSTDRLRGEHENTKIETHGSKTLSNTEEQTSDKKELDDSTLSHMNPSPNQYNRPQIHNQQSNRNNNHNSQYQHYPHQQNNYQRRRYYNNYNSSEAIQQANPIPFQQQMSSFGPYNGRVPRSFNNGYRPRYQQQDPVSSFYHPYYAVQPMMMAITSIAKQIEYYFSAENLNRDNFLRSKLSEEGYAPLSLIAKFYRIVNMSFGGDSNLILASLKNIVSDENASVEIALGSCVKGEAEFTEGVSPFAQFFIRSKDWESLLPDEFSTVVNIEKNLTPELTDEIIINLPVGSLDMPMYDDSYSRNGYENKDLDNSENDPETSSVQMQSGGQ